MSEFLTDQSELPSAPFYVTMLDSFMSGWGPAEGRDARYVAVCDSREQAEIVAANARARGDQGDVVIVDQAPHIHRESLFVLMTSENSSRWYEAGAFA